MRLRVSWLFSTGVAALLLAIGASSPASAGTIYQYAGNPMSPNGALSGFIDIATPLLPNLVNQDIAGAISNFSFTDTIATIDASNYAAGVFGFRVTTNSVGAIVNWNYRLAMAPANPGDIAFASCNGLSACLSAGPFDRSGQWDGANVFAMRQNQNQPGNWSVVPEPSTAILLGLGVAGLSLRRG